MSLSTTFPSLDTRYRQNQASLSQDVEASRQDASPVDYEFNTVVLAHGSNPLTSEAVLETFARLVANFTGEEEILFRYSLPPVDGHTEETRHGLATAVLELSGDATVQRHPGEQYSHPGAQTDFSVEIFENGATSQISATPLSLRLEFGSEITISIHYPQKLMCSAIGQSVLTTFAELLGSKSFVQTLAGFAPAPSRLNYPSLSRPPHIREDLTFNHYANGASLLHKPFTRRAKDFPNRPALDFLKALPTASAPGVHEVYTYEELDNLTNVLALHLRDIVSPRDNRQPVIPAIISSSVELYVSWLGTIKAGFAFCPVSPEAPIDQMEYVFQDVQASALLGRGDRETTFQGELRGQYTWIDVTALIADWHAVGKPAVASELLPSIDENDLAYVMYTSGSTGRPKGVQVPHIAAACSIASHSLYFSWRATSNPSRWFQFAAPTFDPSVMEIFVTFSTGTTLCSAERQISLSDPDSTITELGATIMMATPSMAAILNPSKIPSLKDLWVMGEAVNRRVIENFSSDSAPYIERHGTNTRPEKEGLSNYYGPTEGAINCTVVSDFSVNDRGSIIGKPLPTCSMLIIEPSKSEPVLVPIGFPGELVIGGPQVSRGYLNRPEETAKAFVEESAYGRLYRTGDRARIVQDQSGCFTIEYLGRLTTDQVKLSGRRVELGDIEAVVEKVQGVKEAVVVAHKPVGGGHGSEQVVACILPFEGVDQQALIKEAQAAADKWLQPHMRPRKYFFLDHMPRSRSGKIDRKIVGKLVQELWTESAAPTAESDDSGVEVDQEVQAAVLEAASSVADVPASSIPLNSELLSFGFDSLRSMRFLQQAREANLTGLTVSDVVTCRTFRDLILKYMASAKPSDASEQSAAEYWNSTVEEFRRKHASEAAEAVGVSVDAIEKILPTTSTQSGMIASFLRSLSDPSKEARRHYINHSVYEVAPGVDINAVTEAWLRALHAGQAFRTVFASVDDDLAPFAQLILKDTCPKGQLPLHKYGSTQTPDEEFASLVNKALEDAEGSIELESPPLNLALLQSNGRAAVVLSLFHAIFDGGSLQLLVQDVEDQYHGKEPARRTQIDSAVETHFRADREKAKEFWLNQLEDCAPTTFPQLSRRQPIFLPKGPQVATVLGQTSMEDLLSASKAAHVSSLAILQAAWSVVLFAYTGSKADVVFGSVISDRYGQDTADCMGPTFVTVPIRVSANTEDPLSVLTKDVAQRLTAQNTQALQHLHTPLSSIVTSEGRLHYDTLIAFQSFAGGQQGSSLWSSIEYPPMGNDFAVMLEIWPTETGRLLLKATYENKHLDDLAANTMLKQLDDAIQYVMANQDMPFLDARFAPKPELLSSFPEEVSAEAEPSLLLHAPFENLAVSKPDDSALEFYHNLEGSKTQLSFSELNARADALAKYLVGRLGPLTDRVVPICMEKCTELYIALLGILKAGGAWCPIHPEFPPRRQHDLIARTDASLLIVAHATKDIDSAAIPEGVSTLDVSAPLDAHPEVRLPTPQPSNLAYLIFTSGTTGAPKGVPISHAAAASAMRSLCKVIPSSTRSGAVRGLQFSQYTFDVFVEDLFEIWGMGGTIVSAPKQLLLGSFVQLANLSEATHSHLTPAFASAISRNDLKTMEVVTMIGEKLNQPVADDWGTDMRAYNTYGPAEAAVVSTVEQFGPGDYKMVKSGNVGVPLETLGAYVLQNGRPIMRNGIGELALSGIQLSQGYWKDAEKSRERFIFCEALNRKVYLTGDLVRQLGDGSIEFVGRDDDLVKIAGQRVELSEIAYWLRGTHAGVQQVEVLYLESKKRSGKMVVAFLAVPAFEDAAETATKPVTSPEAAQLIDAVLQGGQRVLPPHMIPELFVVLPRIPRTPSAKVDRHALKAIFLSHEEKHVEEIVENDESDNEWRQANSTLVDIIASATGAKINAIRANSTLSQLGIDSIGAIRLAAKLNSGLFALSVLDVLRCRTVSDITKFAGSKQKKVVLQQEMSTCHELWFDAVKERIGHDRFQVVPASILQESLLGESMQNPESYWSNHVFKLDSNVDLDDLYDAWLSLAQETEALRAGFVPVAAVRKPENADVDSIFLQVVYQQEKVKWNVRAASQSDITQVSREISLEIAHQHQATLFQNPPWAVTVLDHGVDKTMILTIHHSLHDGPSLDAIFSELATKYHGAASKPRCQLLEALLISRADTNARDNEVYWEKELEGLTSEIHENLLPKSPSDAANSTMRTQETHLSMSKTQLQEATRKLGATSIAAVLRAAFGSNLAEFAEAQDIVFGEVLSDRIVDPRLENAIAPLISVVPVPFRVKNTSRELVADQTRVSQGTWEHRHVRPGTVRRVLSRPMDQSLYPAMFVFHPEGEASAGSEALPWTKAEDAVLQVEHAMAFNIWEEGEVLKLEFAVADYVMGPEHQALFARQIDALLIAMAEHPDEPVADLTNFFPTELKSISPARADTKCPADYDPTFWVDHWAQTHPDWRAVEIATQTWPEAITSSWDYKTLNDYANRVAAFIAKYATTNGSVAICLPRTLEAYGTILGVFKSGKTYLPIEEALPNERKAFLVQDSNASILFTTEDLIEPAPEFDACKVVNINDPVYKNELQSINEFPTVTYDPHANGYILYTSGSTGKPKGVLVSRQNLASFLEGMSELICDAQPITPKLGGKGKYLNLASRAFDVHVLEMFMPWRHGMSIATAKRTMLLDDLHAALKNMSVSHASFVPSLLDQTGITPEDVPDLVFLTVGGEKMTEKSRKLWGGHDRVKLVNAYGPTEVTIGCTMARVTPQSDSRNIGFPIGDCVGHVLRVGSDSYVKKAMGGELCFTGSFVANGYLNRPDAKGFVDDFHGERMYRTGDIVRILPDNSIEFLGRKDDQVKIRGQRVELGEIAEGVRVSSSEPINAAALVLKHKDLNRQQLVAFVAYKNDKKEKKTECFFVEDKYDEINATLRPQCQKILPVFMVPDIIVPVSTIPLTATSAKADVKLLSALFSSIPISRLMSGANSNTGASASSNRPLNEEEQVIAAIVKDVIQDESKDIRPDTSIFELGIDSLSAIGLFMKLRDAGYTCSVANVLTHPLIEQLAQLPRNDKAAGGVSAAEQIKKDLAQIDADLRSSADLPVPSEQVAAIRPCLPLQEIMVARSVDTGDDEKSFYVNHVLLKTAAGVDMSRFCQAWEATVAENEILRTTFWFAGDNFKQVVLRPEATQIQWTSVKADSIKQKYSPIARDIAQKIATKPPVRFTFAVSEGGQRTALLLSIHHSLYDGESLGLLFEEVHQRYHGEAPEPRPSPNALVEHILLVDKEAAKKYWTNLLNGWERTRLVAAEEVDQSEVAVKDRTLTASLSAIEAAASRQKLTVAAVMEAAFGIALAQMLGYNDIIFGAVLSGRSVPVQDVSRILAPCITTIPQRVNLTKFGNTLQDVFATFQKLSYESLDYQHTSARDIQMWTGADRPLYDSLFSFTKVPEETEDSQLWKEVESEMPTDWTLALEVESFDKADQLKLTANCTAAFGDAARAGELLERVEMLVDVVLNGEPLALEELGISVEESDVAVIAKAPAWDESNWSAEEQELRALVSDFAQVPTEQVGKNTSFLHIGIDSITAIRFARTLREHGYNVSSADVMRNSCVGALAHNFTSSKTKDEPVEKTMVDSAIAFAEPELQVPASVAPGEKVEAVYNCTPLQVGMITQTLGLDPRLYVHHHLLRLSADVDLTKFQEAWNKTVRQLDVLRTSFHRNGSEWVAVVHEDRLPIWSDVESSTVEAALQKLREVMKFTNASHFNTPPVKATMITAGSEKVFSISMHHALYDGLSIPILFQQVTDNYLGRPVPDATPFYKAAKMMTSNQAAAVEFWSKRLEGYQSIQVPLTKEEAASTQMSIGSITAISNLAAVQEKGFSPQTVAMLAFAKSLSCLVQRRDVAFGMVLAGRNLQLDNPDTIIGPTFNTVPYRVRLANPLSSNQAVIQQLQQQMVDGIEFQHASFADVQNRWRQGQAAAAGSAVLTDSIFVFQKIDSGAFESSESVWKPYETEEDFITSEYNMNFEVEQHSNELIARAYSKLGKERLDAFLTGFKEAVQDIIENPERYVTAHPAELRSLPLKSEAAEAEVITWDDPAVQRYGETIRSAMATVVNLPVEKIEPSTNIFSIGLDSIAAIQVASICRKAGVRVGVATIIQGVTLGGICRSLSQQDSEPAVQVKELPPVLNPSEEATALANLGVDKEQVEAILPLLAGQDYHMASWLQSGRTLYEPTWAFKARAPLDIARLSMAWNALQERHSIMRTAFVAVGADKCVQVVLKPEEIDDTTFNVVWSNKPLDQVAKTCVRKTFHAPSNLYRPPVRLQLVRAPEDDALLITMHHTTYDAWTMSRLISDLLALYSKRPLPALPSFSSFVDFNRKAMSTVDERAFWEQHLTACTPTILPSVSESAELDNPKSRKQTFVMCNSSNFDLAAAEAKCREHGRQLHTLVLLAFARTLAQLTSTDSPTFGFFQTGRSASFEDMENVSGPTVNLLPLGLRDVRSRPLNDVAQDLMEKLGARIPYEHSRLRDVAGWVGPDGKMPFNASLNLLWHDDVMKSEYAEGMVDIYNVGVPTDFSSERVIPGETSVDDLSYDWIQRDQLFVDVGPDRAANGVKFGVRADAKLMGEDGVKAILAVFEQQIAQVVQEVEA
ncbi:BcNRPS3, nonribosomal peptide synthetase [Phyllosticta capitalensis]|uniref:BcNRPS3, nonribosomal peptide synthetase n=1 Tax=Phyllosticta capitalensis TaxID=121624 RepID=A0ABR1YX00_9PEZI